MRRFPSVTRRHIDFLRGTTVMSGHNCPWCYYDLNGVHQRKTREPIDDTELQLPPTDDDRVGED